MYKGDLDHNCYFDCVAWVLLCAGKANPTLAFLPLTRCRYVRERDRLGNEYPKLHYPELYVLKGGYKEFFMKCQVRLGLWRASLLPLPQW